VVEEFDFETGRLLDALDALGLTSDTLVIYTTDNGPWNQPAYTKNEKGHPAGANFGIHHHAVDHENATTAGGQKCPHSV
jgi:arylsulfatase A-like enzyme